MFGRNCDAAYIIIPRREFILCTCNVEGSLALDPPQNKSLSRLLFQAYGKLANNVGVNLGLEWSPTLARGFPIHFHIPYQVLRFPTPSDAGKKRQISAVVKCPKFPCNVLRCNKTFSENQWLRYEAETDMRDRRRINRGNNTTNRFQH